MTTTERRHLTYPSLDRLKDRLASAQDDHLQVWNIEQWQHDPLTHEWRALCTPTLDMEPYEVMVRWQMPEDQAHVHCSCTAGSYGTPCKHAALLLSHLSLLTKQTRVRVMDSAEWERYNTLAILPEWRGE